VPITAFYRFTCPVCQQSQDFYSSGNHEGWLTVAGEQFNSVVCATAAYESVYGHAPADAPPADPPPVGWITPDPVPPIDVALVDTAAAADDAVTISA
jgi:hypothetical protein